MFSLLKDRSWRLAIITILGLSFLLLEIVILVLYRETWFDELLYLFKGRAAIGGSLVPFQDMIIAHPPLAFLLHGITQYIWGPSILLGRIVSSIIFFGILWIMYVIADRYAGALAGVGALFLMVSNVFLVGNYVSAVPFGLSVIFILLSIWVELLKISSQRKTLLSAFLIGLAVLTRINLLPAAIMYVLFLAVTRRGWREIGSFSIVFVVILFLGFTPFLLLDFSLAISVILAPFVSIGLLSSLPSSVKADGFSFSEFLPTIVSFVREYDLTLLLFFAVTSLLLFSVWNTRDRFLKTEPVYVLLLMIGTGLFIPHYFYWKISGSLVYANYFFPFLILAIVIGIFRFFPEKKVLIVFLVGVISLNFLGNMFRTDIISHPNDETDLERINRGAMLLKKHTNPEDLIIAFDNSIFHVFAADRVTKGPLLNRNFMFVGLPDTSLVNRILHYNPEILLTWIDNADYVVLHEEKWPWTFRRTFRSVDGYDSEAFIHQVERLLNDRYVLEDRAFNVYPRKYTEGNDGGTLLLYRRIK